MVSSANSQSPTLSPQVPQIDLHAQHLECEADLKAAFDAVLHESAFIQGGFVRAFEEAFAAFGVANGTDALALALCLLMLSR